MHRYSVGICPCLGEVVFDGSTYIRMAYYILGSMLFNIGRLFPHPVGTAVM